MCPTSAHPNNLLLVLLFLHFVLLLHLFFFFINVTLVVLSIAPRYRPYQAQNILCLLTVIKIKYLSIHINY